MAKYSIEEGEDRTIDVSVTRAQLIDFVNNGIRRALDNQYAGYTREDAEVEIQPEVLRTIARTTDRIDALTWKGINSCGCPMVKAGRVVLGVFDGIDPPNPINEFVGGYDSAVSSFVSQSNLNVGGGPYTLIVSD